MLNKIQNNFHKLKKSIIFKLSIIALIGTICIRADLSLKHQVFKFLLEKSQHQTSTESIEDNSRLILTKGIALIIVKNTGTAFGQFNKIPNAQIVLSIMTIILESIIVSFFFLSKSRIQKAGIFLIFCGGFGNLYDRLKFGYVRDFLDLYIGNYHWPAFNLADVFVVSGVIVLIVYDIIINSATKKAKTD